MSNSTALAVMRLALQQYGYKEHPAGSNKTKYGKAFGMNGVFWCAIFVWWCGEKPSGDNPIYKSANAADIQDLTVKKKGGKYILKQTANNTKKKQALPNVQFGDQISFNFSGGSSRVHTALVVGVVGNNIYCIEGNTSFGSKGSQSNGGCVALRKRYYTTGVCIDRPAYSPFKFHTPTTPYKGEVPKLPSRGYFKYGDKGQKVANLQTALAWANGYGLKADKEFGSLTFAEVVIFQVANNLTPDGEFGEKSLAVLNALIKKHKDDNKVKTKAEKIASKAKQLSYAYGTDKATYKYPTGKPKKDYTIALDKAYPDRDKWSKQARDGASCDVFVGTTMRRSVDPHFPRGLDEQYPYMKNHKELYIDTGITDRSKMKPGDIIYEDYGGKGTGGHISIFLGGNRIAQAQHGGKTYPHITAYTSQIHDPKKCDVFKVYRIKE